MNIFSYLHYGERNTRQSKARRLRLPKTRTIVATGSIANMSPNIWNSIKPELNLKKEKQTNSHH